MFSTAWDRTSTPAHWTICETVCAERMASMPLNLLVSSFLHCYRRRMGEHVAPLTFNRPQVSRKLPGKQTAVAMGRRLLGVIVYEKRCGIGATVSLDDLEATEIGDWKMPDFKAACAYAASQGWLIVQNDVLTLTTAGL